METRTCGDVDGFGEGVVVAVVDDLDGRHGSRPGGLGLAALHLGLIPEPYRAHQ